MEKPVLQREVKEYYQFFTCRNYIKEKYDFSDREIKNFWNYLCDYKGINNDSYFHMGFEDYEKPSDTSLLEVWEAFKKEFSGERKFAEFYVSW